jgi:hypothetical protein
MREHSRPFAPTNVVNCTFDARPREIAPGNCDHAVTRTIETPGQITRRGTEHHAATAALVVV